MLWFLYLHISPSDINAQLLSACLITPGLNSRDQQDDGDCRQLTRLLGKRHPSALTTESLHSEGRRAAH